jgi:predicted polyphosphate/ATP-dependent NAD kinase
MSPRIGFVVNPIAGMGGRVGLKGTDDMLGRAVELGAKPIANARAVEALREFKRRCLQQTVPPAIDWVTCGDGMGADALAAAGIEGVRIIAETPTPTTADDTKSATRQFLDVGVDLILFCGGDGTARDIASIARTRVPILGIPSGVKMFSGVFAVTPARTAEILIGFLNHELTLVEVEVVDLDEEKYRAGQWAVRYVQNVLTPFEPTFTQVAKQIVAESSDTESKAEIARYVSEMIVTHPQVLFILGAGGTLKTVAAELGVQKTLLGIDAVLNGRLVARDLNERSLLALLDNHPDCRLILSPIGAQGFILGRGNLQLSPEVIRRIGVANIMVLATPSKLARTPQVRFDTGDASLDAELVGLGFLSVVTGYRRHRLVKIVG